MFRSIFKDIVCPKNFKFRAGILLLGLLFLSPAAQAVGDLDISGIYYKKIVDMKDTIADILPPPAYIIESYLVVLQTIDAAEKGDKAKIDELIEYGRKLKEGDSSKGEIAGYFERIAVWVKDLPEKTPEDKKIKKLMTSSSVAPAKKFYEIRDKKFIPAIKAGKIADAIKIVRNELKPAYNDHRKQIDLLVAESTKAFQAAEKEAAERLAKGETGGDLKVKGKLYTRIIMQKDVIADVLPPPCYIIESLLVVFQMIDEVDANGGKVPADFAKMVEYGRQLKEGNSAKGEMAGYLERQNYWMTNLSDKTIPEKKAKELMTKTSAEPAKKFFQIRDSKLIPALQAGKVADAKKVLREELQPLYDEHRKAIDDLVSRADKVYKQLEAEVSQQLAK